MAEIVGSAVVQESVSKILSCLLQKYEEKQNSNAIRNLERLEMAHIRLEAILQTSDKWVITDTSLLRWRRKLKSAAQECDDTLHRCRQRILEDEHIEKEGASLAGCRSSLHDHPYQRAGVLFAPHGSSEDMLLVDKFPAIAATNSEEQNCLHTVFTLGQLEQIILPKAIDFFCQNEEATIYQMLWRSKHGTAYIQVERASIFMPSTWRTFHGAKRRKLLQGLDEELECLTYLVSRFLDLWASHASIQLEGSIMDWYQEVKEKHKQHIPAA